MSFNIQAKQTNMKVTHYISSDLLCIKIIQVYKLCEIDKLYSRIHIFNTLTWFSILFVYARKNVPLKYVIKHGLPRDTNRDVICLYIYDVFTLSKN